jgi:hypothetical protein
MDKSSRAEPLEAHRAIPSASNQIDPQIWQSFSAMTLQRSESEKSMNG